MTEEPEPDAPVHRDNGLIATSYAALVDCHPPVADRLLDALARAGIAGYAEPFDATSDSVLPTAPPPSPAVRVWADATAIGAARAVLAAVRAGERDPMAPDRPIAPGQWEEIIAGLSTPAAPGPRPWPTAEDLPPGPTPVPPRNWEPPLTDDHFVPPAPPPPPRLSAPTAYAVAAIVGGLTVLAVPALAGSPVDSTWALLAVASIIGGAVTLVARMRTGPPTDSGPDDGAVV